MKRASKSGGKNVKLLMNKWEIGSKYKFTVFYSELDAVNVEHENRKLKGEKRKLEESLEEETSKRMRTKDQLKKAENTMKSGEEKYRKKFKQLVNKVAKLSSANKKSRGPEKKKTFNQYSNKHQVRVRKQLKEQCQTALSFLGQYNFVPSKIELYNEDTGVADSFTFTDNDEFVVAEAGEITEDELNNLNMWLNIKDKFNISHEAWHEIAMKSDDPPCLYKIIKQMKQINQKWNVKATPGEAEGVQASFKEIIVDHVRRLKSNGVIKDGETIKIKLSGDAWY
jgi:phosphoenolpyruvate carboxylase